MEKTGMNAIFGVLERTENRPANDVSDRLENNVENGHENDWENDSNWNDSGVWGQSD